MFLILKILDIYSIIIGFVFYNQKYYYNYIIRIWILYKTNMIRDITMASLHQQFFLTLVTSLCNRNCGNFYFYLRYTIPTLHNTYLDLFLLGFIFTRWAVPFFKNAFKANWVTTNSSSLPMIKVFIKDLTGKKIPEDRTYMCNE